jgi:hypothetical protein
MPNVLRLYHQAEDKIVTITSCRLPEACRLSLWNT